MYAITLLDTVPVMLSKDYRERFIAEYQQLTCRMLKLNQFIIDAKAGTVPHDCPIELLQKQRDAMQVYHDILRERAAIENIII